MTYRVCRNCGSEEIYAKEVAANSYQGGPHLLPLGGWIPSEYFDIRICGQCGLTEWFVSRPTLERVKRKFPRLK